MKPLLARIVFCILLFGLSAGVPAQIAQLDTLIEKMRADSRVPGLAVGVVDGGRVVYARAFGVRDLQTGAPVTTDTLFHIASVSKTFTATAVMQLVEKRKLALTDAVEKFLPAFAGSGITIEQLLTHSAGLEDRIRPSGANEEEEVAKYVARVAKQRRSYLPGQGWEYSDADFNILGAVIEVASGVIYPIYIEAQVFRPARLTRTTTRWPGADADIAWPHRGEKSPKRASKHPWDRVFLPSSGIEASINDLLRWAQVNLARDPHLLSPASYAAMFERHVDTQWPNVAMGLGWQLEQRGDTLLPFHPGGDPGFRSMLTLYPARQRAIVILSNGEGTPRWEIRAAIEAILDSP